MKVNTDSGLKPNTFWSVTYDAFISPGAIQGVAGDYCRSGSTLYQLWYAGDHRTFGPPILFGRYRAIQRANLVPSASESSAGVDGQSSDTGYTHVYPETAIINKDTDPIPDPTISDDDPLGDCYRLHNLVKLDPARVANKNQVVRLSDHSVSLKMSGDAVKPGIPIFDFDTWHHLGTYSLVRRFRSQ